MFSIYFLNISKNYSGSIFYQSGMLLILRKIEKYSNAKIKCYRNKIYVKTENNYRHT